ncbi:TCN1, partial [Cervus elaphus hippelaphus]
MRPPRQLPLMGLLFFSLIPSQLCQICKPLINTMLKANYTKGIQNANVLLTLRLVGIKNQSLEQQLSQQIKEDINSKEMELTSGQLALGILALGACENPDEEFIHGAHLVSKLGDKFQAEIQNMETHDGNPLTNYYQLSLALLALCLFNGSYSITSVTYYFTPENKNYYFGDQFSVATLAKKIQSEGKQGLFGNIFSTGEAMQALFVSSDYYKSKTNCQETLRTVFYNISQNAFSLPIAAAQILPALMGKTYLDVTNTSCSHNPVEETSWGPYVTSVQGIRASSSDRTYWQLLSNGQPLSQ